MLHGIMKQSGVAVAAVLLTVSTASASVIFSDNFNSETAGLNTTPSQWSLVSGSVDVIPSGGLYDFYPGNGLYVDMDGSTGQAGSIKTTAQFAYTSGQQYQLTFDYGLNSSGGVPQYLNYSFGGMSGMVTISSRPSSLQSYSVLFAPTTSGVGSLAFSASPDGYSGPILDNVVLSAVPLPATGLLLLGGLAGLGSLRRRKRA